MVIYFKVFAAAQQDTAQEPDVFLANNKFGAMPPAPTLVKSSGLSIRIGISIS